MYQCYLHNWFSHEGQCPSCLKVITTSTTTNQEREVRQGNLEWHGKDEWVREYEMLRQVMNMPDAIFQLVQMVQSEYETNMNL